MIGGAAAGLAAATIPAFSRRAFAAGTVNFADIGVGDPDGDWSRYTAIADGWNVNLVAIGNAPSAILNTLVAGGGTASYDVINIVGGMQKPLVGGFEEIEETLQAFNWPRTRTSRDFCKARPVSASSGIRTRFTASHGAETDSFAYCPKNGHSIPRLALRSKWKGYIALEDNYTTAGQKTALYLKGEPPKIDNPTT
jgi:hypothetical protein